MKKTTLFFFFIFLLFFSSSHAQNRPSQPSVQEIIKIYQNFNYLGVELLSKKALSSRENYSLDELLQIHLYYGCAAFAKGDTATARSQFYALLSIDPDYKLSPLLFSPKIQKFFNSVKSDYRKNKKNSKTWNDRYIFYKDNRYPALKRSILFPGWGQHYLGQKKKGLLLMGSEIFSLSGTIAFYFLTARAHHNYLTAKQPDRIESNYQTYQQFYRIRNTFTLLSASVWVFSAMDILLKKKPVLQPFHENLSLNFSTHHLVVISYQHRF
ncbi:MAG: hypothetical protein GXO76_00290 [Calditrichaeota bacterium]|nr:hypothetical protein [Calditrichota bacterium]